MWLLQANMIAWIAGTILAEKIKHLVFGNDMSKGWYYIIFTMLAGEVTLTASCKKPFAPSIAASNTNFLVVEGVINSGLDSTIVNLSRTVNVKAKVNSKPELNAIVTVENNQQASYSLQEIANGKYALVNFQLDTTLKYRLRIKTNDGKEYLSDFVEVKNAPPIDTLGYRIQNDGVYIYLNTQDHNNNTHFFRWDYDETWVFNSAFESYFKIVNGQPIYRSPDEEVYFCWGNDHASTILLKSTGQLTQDKIDNQQIAYVASTSEKLTHRYSIIVREYAMTRQGYDYYTNMKKNTEQLGGIFDVQPSSIKGNITCISSPSTPVIGFVSAGSISSKRIFIDNRDLPAWQAYTYYDQTDCKDNLVNVTSEADFAQFYGGDNPPFLPTVSVNKAGATECVDCTLRGTNKKPSFWR
ncbi:MAG: DUF4249 domain-containing protein [Mucilaginibacter sp.]